MIEINKSWYRLPPYQHQDRGVRTLVAKPVYGLFWQMRLGKTKAIVDAACVLRRNGLLDAVVICCPAQVKDVWNHKELGEVRKHAFEPFKELTVDGKTEDYVDILAQEEKDLLFMTISHEKLRQEDARADFPLAHVVKNALQAKKVWIVYDEASAFGNHKSLQTKGALQLRKLVKPARVTTLDGTPIGNHPKEQYSKFKVLDEAILGYKSFFHFRAVHQVTEPNRWAKRGKAYVGFQKQEIIDRRVKPFCEYLAQEDALDMPAKVRTFLTCALDRKSWRQYCQMRDDMVAELDSGEVSVQHAAVKVMRLAQMCSGFVGGAENEVTGEQEVRELSCETADLAVEWVKRRLDEDENFKAVIWCHWRPEIARLVARLEKIRNLMVGQAWGQKKDKLELLHPDDQTWHGPMILVAQPQAVQYGKNFSRAVTEMFLSQSYNLVTRQQAEERIQPREGVRETTLVVDVLVTGPDGQKTVTWDIKKCVDEKAQVAARTVAEWKKILVEE